MVVSCDCQRPGVGDDCPCACHDRCICGHFKECAQDKTGLCWENADVTEVSADLWDELTQGDA